MGKRGGNNSGGNNIRGCSSRCIGERGSGGGISFRVVVIVLGMVVVLSLLGGEVRADGAERVNVALVSVDGADLSGSLLSVQYADRVERMVLREGELVIDVPEDGDRVLFIADFLNTVAKDYFGEMDSVTGSVGSRSDGSGVEVVMFPIGYVQGRVVDSKNNLVGGAELLFECSHGFDISYPRQTDVVGGFRVPNMPAGSCRVRSSMGDMAGYFDIVIKRGEVVDMEVVMGQRVRRGVWRWVVVMVVIGGVFAAGAFWLRGRPKIKFNSKKNAKRWGKAKVYGLGVARGNENSGSRGETGKGRGVDRGVGSGDVERERRRTNSEVILKTLGEKEKRVVEFLMASDGRSSTATIRHECNIPRTSLFRVIAGLEKKKIIEVEKVGKMVKVKLSSLFLEK